MSKIKGEYIPSPADVKNVKLWIENFERSCFPTIKNPPVQDWDKYKEEHENYRCGLTQPNMIYQSKYFPFIMDIDKGRSIIDCKLFKYEKDFQDFIKNSRYLISRCYMGTDTWYGKEHRFAIYYHKDFGKVGWLQNKIQFFINRYNISKRFINWFYGINKIKCPKFKINITCAD